MNKTRVAINGFGRIGRAFLKVAMNRPEIEIVAVNDLGDVNNLAYLLKYDTAYGHFDKKVLVEGGDLIVNDKKIKYFSKSNPLELPWGLLKVDVVVESTGFFTSYEKAKVHLDAGAKKVVISAPVKGDKVAGVTGLNQSDGLVGRTGERPVLGETILMGINEDKFGTCQISSNGSCTTNASSPLIAILDESIGIEKAVLNTVHAYTASQSIVDGPKKDFREGRAAAQNIIPTSTGAAISVTEALPNLRGKFDGISMRVPVVAGSIVDITFIAKRNTTRDEVNGILKKASNSPRWKNIFLATEEQLVSSDILGSRFASIADLEMTRVVGGNLVKVLGWYDNEMGYTHTLVEHVIKAANSADSRNYF